MSRVLTGEAQAGFGVTNLHLQEAEQVLQTGKSNAALSGSSELSQV